MSEKQQQVIDRGLEAKKFIEAPVYQKVLNSLIDDCVGAWASSKIEEKEKRDMFWHRYQSAIAMHSTLQSWIAAGEQEQSLTRGEGSKKPNNEEIH